MLIDETTSRADLEFAIISERDLYNSINEARFLNGRYTDAELLTIIQGWIVSGDECAP
jgi:hypothetical protein